MGRKRLDLTGKQFGHLTVTEYSGRLNNSSGWITNCTCGNTKLVTSSDLVAGNVKSCGCLSTSGRFKTKETNELAAFNHLYKTYKVRANKNIRCFELTKDDFRSITLENCYYCNAPPSRIYKYGKRDKSVYIYNGVDRKDNNLGYTISNSLSCCYICNRSKNDMKYEEFIEYLDNLIKYRSNL